MSKATEINTRISALQKQMVKERVSAWIILSSDPHLSEYLPDHWKLREWFSGFTGSAGSLVVLKDRAYVWADSRYWVQAAQELKGSVVTLMKMGDGKTPHIQSTSKKTYQKRVLLLFSVTQSRLKTSLKPMKP